MGSAGCNRLLDLAEAIVRDGYVPHLKTFTSFPMLPSSASDSPIHPRKWSSSDTRSISQFVANSSSSVSTPKRNPSIKNDNCCVEECGYSGIVMPYERQPGLMPFAVPTPLWYPQAPPPTVPICMGPLMSVPYSEYVPPISNQRLKPLKKKQTNSACSQMCCGGIAQLLWTIIVIVIMGMLAALILALLVV